MQQAPSYTADRYPADFVQSLKAALLTSAISMPLLWWAARTYLIRSYRAHTELLPAAIVVALMDGALLGLAAFVITFAIRIWRYECKERKRSDDLLRLALVEIESKRDERP